MAAHFKKVVPIIVIVAVILLVASTYSGLSSLPAGALVSGINKLSNQNLRVVSAPQISACSYDTDVFKPGKFVQGVDPATGIKTPIFLVSTYAPKISAVCNPRDTACLRSASAKPIAIGLQLQQVTDSVYSNCGYNQFPVAAVSSCQISNFHVGENVQLCTCQNPPNLQGPAPFPGVLWVPPNAPDAPRVCDATKCVANAACDRLAPDSAIPFCAKGGSTGIHDRCNSMCQTEDRPDMICGRVGSLDCTGDAQCNGIISGSSGCDSNCKFTGTFTTTVISTPFLIDAWGQRGWGDCSAQTGGADLADSYCKCNGFDGAVSCFQDYAADRWIWNFDAAACSTVGDKGRWTDMGLAFVSVTCFQRS